MRWLGFKPTKSTWQKYTIASPSQKCWLQKTLDSPPEERVASLLEKAKGDSMRGRQPSTRVEVSNPKGTLSALQVLVRS
jgi:hypothetical protein